MRIYNETTEPTAIINGFHVRPGMFDVYGATAVSRGVNFTVHTHYGTSCELLLFHQGDETPYATIPFPKAYKIGDVYSMLVFGLNIEEFEYAYRVDGPYDPREGHLFDRDAILLDPYAKAVTGQSVWGEKKITDYHARVVRDTFDWGDMPQSKTELSDLVIYELHVRGYTKHESSGADAPHNLLTVIQAAVRPGAHNRSDSAAVTKQRPGSSEKIGSELHPACRTEMFPELPFQMRRNIRRNNPCRIKVKFIDRAHKLFICRSHEAGYNPVHSVFCHDGHIDARSPYLAHYTAASACIRFTQAPVSLGRTAFNNKFHSQSTYLPCIFQCTRP